MKRKKDTLCWSCKKACCGCSWSKFFIPVKGWVAEPTIIADKAETYKINSYHVKSCPKYINEGISKTKTYKELAAELGISVRTFFRRKAKLKKGGENMTLETLQAMAEDAQRQGVIDSVMDDFWSAFSWTGGENNI